MPIGLDTINEAVFRNAARRLVDEYRARFGERLVATYVWGSVHRGEAVPGVSDLDLHYFISDAFLPADEAWIQQVWKKLDRQEWDLGGTTRPRPVAVLSSDSGPAFRFRLRYDATLIWGRDVIEGLQIPPADRDWARRQFASPWDLTRYAAGIDAENRTDFQLPDDPSRKLRKLARLGVLGGGCLLMAHDRFRSYRGTDVLPSLQGLFPQWQSFLRQTEALYIQPVVPTFEQVTGYLFELVGWMDWIGAQLQ